MTSALVFRACSTMAPRLRSMRARLRNRLRRVAALRQLEDETLNYVLFALLWVALSAVIYGVITGIGATYWGWFTPEILSFGEVMVAIGGFGGAAIALLAALRTLRTPVADLTLDVVPEEGHNDEDFEEAFASHVLILGNEGDVPARGVTLTVLLAVTDEQLEGFTEEPGSSRVDRSLTPLFASPTLSSWDVEDIHPGERRVLLSYRAPTDLIHITVASTNAGVVLWPDIFFHG